MNKLSVSASAVAAVGILYWAAVIALLPLLRSDLDPRIYWISEYANGPYGWVQNTAFLAASLGAAALIVGLIRTGPRSWIATTGLVFLAVLVPGLFISALFHVDARGQPETTHGLTHDLSAFANVIGGVVGQIFLAASFGDDPRWRSIRGAALIVAALSVLALANQFLSSALHLPWGGISNRILAGSLTLWWLLAALRVRKVAKGLPAR